MAYPQPQPQPHPHPHPHPQPYPQLQPQPQFAPAQPSGTALAAPFPIIGLQYCASYPVDLSMVKQVYTHADSFEVSDSNGTIIFRLKGKLFTLRDRRTLLDGVGNPILTMRRKLMTVHDRWEAFMGDSKDPKDLVFTLKTSHLFHLKTSLDVFLANNTKQEVCDFKVKGTWSARSCVVYAGESTSIVAQMHEKETIESYTMGKDRFDVTVYPNMDYAFIVSLIVILAEINADNAGE